MMEPDSHHGQKKTDRNVPMTPRHAGLSYLTSCSPPNGAPLFGKFDVKPCRLEDTDKHEDIASPSADHLDQPTLPHSREHSVVTSRAVAHVPEDVAASGAFAAGRRRSRPRGICHACGRTVAREPEARTSVTTNLPRAYDKNHHWLDINKNGRKQRDHGGSLPCPESAFRPHPLASPPHKLRKIEHKRQHNGDLQSMEEINDSCAGAPVHHAGANIKECSDHHRPASGTNDSGERSNQPANCTQQLHHAHWLERLFGGSISRVCDRGWSSVTIWASLVNKWLSGGSWCHLSTDG